MMKMIEAKILAVLIEQIGVTQTDGYTKVTSLVGGDFTLTLWNNQSVSPIAPLVSELSDGEYMVWFTPDAVGHWVLDIAVPSVTWRVRREYNVVNELMNTQTSKIDIVSTVGPAGAISGSLLDRLANKDSNKTLSSEKARDGAFIRGFVSGIVITTCWAVLIYVMVM